MPKVEKYHAGATLKGTDAFLWFLPELEQNSDIIAYPGSLTTPNFSESVTFAICLKPVTISHEQVNVYYY